MKFNLVIVAFLIMAISSCCAPKTNNKNIDELKAKLQRGIYIVRTKDTTFKVRVN